MLLSSHFYVWIMIHCVLGPRVLTDCLLLNVLYHTVQFCSKARNMACIFHVITVWFMDCCFWFSITSWTLLLSKNREKGYFDMNLLVNWLFLKVLDLLWNNSHSVLFWYCFGQCGIYRKFPVANVRSQNDKSSRLFKWVLALREHITSAFMEI